MSDYHLTAEMRRAVCFHEAGHAVLYALGGAFVYRVAVAPLGATSWQTTGRKGADISDVWGLCEPSGSPGAPHIQWDDDTGDWGADRAGFLRIQNMIDEKFPGSKREARRQIRSTVCGVLGGPAAEEMHRGMAPSLDYDGEWGVFDDAKCAQAHAWLLPWRGELEFLQELTVQMLLRPDVWAFVTRLADALEVAGDIEDLDGFLPEPVRNWPPSPRARKSAPAFAVARADLLSRLALPQGGAA